MQVLSEQIGAEGGISVKVEGGKIILSAEHVHASGKVTITAEEDVKYFLKKLKEQTPNWADLLIDVAATALP